MTINQYIDSYVKLNFAQMVIVAIYAFILFQINHIAAGFINLLASSGIWFLFHSYRKEIILKKRNVKILCSFMLQVKLLILSIMSIIVLKANPDNFPFFCAIVFQNLFLLKVHSGNKELFNKIGLWVSIILTIAIIAGFLK